MGTEAKHQSFLPAGSNYLDLEIEVLRLQREASDLAITEIMERDGVPLNFDHFMLATHGYGRSSRGMQRVQDAEIRQFYNGLEDQFGNKQSDKLVALLSEDVLAGRRRILRIGEIAAMPEPGQQRTEASPIVYRVAKSRSFNYLEGSANVRVRGVIDVSGLDADGSRMGDERLVDGLVEVEEDTHTELWKLSYASTNLQLPGHMPGDTRGNYAVGINSILGARNFEERNWDAEHDQVYLQIVLDAMQRQKLARPALQTA